MPENLSHQPYDYGDPAGGEPTLGAGQPGQPRETVGALLRRTRERYRLHLHEAADQLRIRAAYLDAIERSEFRELPGPTYAVGFVRSYADFLGLDENEIVRRFKDEVEGINRAQQLHFPKPVNEAKVPGGAILLISLVLVAAAYGGWYYLTREGRSVSDLVPAVPERLQALLGTSSPAEGEGAVVAGDSPSGERAGPSTGADAGPGDSDSGADVFRSADSPQSGDVQRDTAADQRAVAGDGEDGDSASARAETGEEPDAGTTSAADAEPPAAPSDNAGDLAGADSGGDGTPPAPTDTADTLAGAGGGVSAAPNQSAQAAETAEPGDVEISEAEREGASGAQGEAAETTARADETSDDSGPPAVPQSGEGQGDADSAIPAAPTGTRTASANDGGGRVFGAGNADARIILRATADSWVQVRGPDDSLLLTRVLHAGDVYRVPNRDGLILHTGNAGGLEVSVDGGPVASLGESGEVRRNIPLAPSELRR